MRLTDPLMTRLTASRSRRKAPVVIVQRFPGGLPRPLNGRQNWSVGCANEIRARLQRALVDRVRIVDVEHNITGVGLNSRFCVAACRTLTGTGGATLIGGAYGAQLWPSLYDHQFAPGFPLARLLMASGLS